MIESTVNFIFYVTIPFFLISPSTFHGGFNYVIDDSNQMRQKNVPLRLNILVDLYNQILHYFLFF